ncbi:hypothetical protein DESC_610339 [Desulfosarcina cetonica]|nr:hypothetical protein DESC_610339 [Desulfosarcina cetonica]
MRDETSGRMIATNREGISGRWPPSGWVGRWDRCRQSTLNRR